MCPIYNLDILWTWGTYISHIDMEMVSDDNNNKNKNNSPIICFNTTHILITCTADGCLSYVTQSVMSKAGKNRQPLTD
jgi:hypothetical protein